VARITTPFDSFIDDLSAWIDSAWFVWIALAVAIVAVVVIVSITKVRARARERIPQYRRHES
jgi:heme exporter protein D